jgi:hypothetical protein
MWLINNDGFFQYTLLERSVKRTVRDNIHFAASSLFEVVLQSHEIH